MPKRSSKPDYEDGKRTPKRKSGRLRERDRQARIQTTLGKLKQTINCPDSPAAQAIGIAAEMLANRPRSEAELLYSLSHYFFEGLEYCWGQAIPISHYWQWFIKVIEGINHNIAKMLLVNGYETTFRWIAFGHVQRLYCNYQLLPEAVQVVKIYQNKEGITTHVGVQRNGKSVIMSKDAYIPHPSVCFPGFYFKPCLHPSDLSKLSKVRNKRELDRVLESKKQPPSYLSDETLLINVGLPQGPNISGMRTTLAFYAWHSQRKQAGSASADKNS